MQIGSFSNSQTASLQDVQSVVPPPAQQAAPTPPRVDNDHDRDSGSTDGDKGKQVNVVA
jgi:hypothetical protein